jgi:hypothetical protein
VIEVTKERQRYLFDPRATVRSLGALRQPRDDEAFSARITISDL